ncbi:hypothetical protein I8748_06725 [Nostoc sp. CENA67]|uniref:Uncharacterized protein n=1 Tax=Amazonocrinis nigriterrae CENA67 TaxID=2794033 RepID=A0A8J7HPS3_9NOST|nr:hypothetical protein [Amazonocrinis nigriterrae CENA67]
MNTQLQLQPLPETFIQPMLELRDYYAQQVEQYEKLHRQALDNLNHVKALLSNWSSSTDATPNFLGEDSRCVTENLTTVNSDDITQLSLNLVKPIDSQVVQFLDVETEDSNSADADQQQQKPVKETQIATSSNLLLHSEVPMLPEYESLTRTEAIQKVLQKHLGTVCHIDFIVRSLYGELEPDSFKVVKGRVQSTLTHGKQTNKWSLVPGQPGCYTLVLSLVNSTSGGSSKKGSNKNRLPSPLAQTNIIPMLEPYKGQFLIDALTSLLQKSPGQVFNVAEVIQALYGELNAEQLREVKPKVLNELSRGHRIGRFSRVPKEIGLYTWDSKLLQQKDPS